MMFGYGKGFTEGVAAGRTASDAALALLRDELSAANRRLDAEMAAHEVTRGKWEQAIQNLVALQSYDSVRPPMMKARVEDRAALEARAEKDLADRVMEDLFAEVPFGDPRGTFKEAADAAL